jgi:hypothetical protein
MSWYFHTIRADWHARKQDKDDSSKDKKKRKNPSDEEEENKLYEFLLASFFGVLFLTIN